MINNPTIVGILVAFAVVFYVALLAVKIGPSFTRAFAPFIRKHPAFVVFAVVLGLYAGTKPTPVAARFYFDGGIKQGETRSFVEGNAVTISWQRDTAGGLYVPESATVYIDHRPHGDADAEWQTLAETTVGAWGWVGTCADAENQDFNVWAYYIPPEPVHTNGVWAYTTITDPETKKRIIPIKAEVRGDGSPIYPPKPQTEANK